MMSTVRDENRIPRTITNNIGDDNKKFLHANDEEVRP